MDVLEEAEHPNLRDLELTMAVWLREIVQKHAFQPFGQISNLGTGNPQNGDIGSFGHVRYASIAIGGIDRLGDMPPAVFKVGDEVCKGAETMAQPPAISVEDRCSALCSASIDGDDQGLAHDVLSILSPLPNWRVVKRN